MAVSAAELLKEADRLKARYGDDINHIIAAEAVLAERERCARAAYEQRCERGTPWDLACVTIATAIREAR